MIKNWWEDCILDKHLEFLKEIENILLRKFDYNKYSKFWMDGKNLLNFENWIRNGSYYWYNLYFYSNRFKIENGLTKIFFNIKYDDCEEKYDLIITIDCFINKFLKTFSFCIYDFDNINLLDLIKQIIIEILNKTDEVTYTKKYSKLETVVNHIEDILNASNSFSYSTFQEDEDDEEV